jgi:hypothetical protein
MVNQWYGESSESMQNEFRVGNWKKTVVALAMDVEEGLYVEERIQMSVALRVDVILVPPLSLGEANQLLTA